MAWREVGAQTDRTWEPNVGDAIEGVLVETKHDVGPNHSEVYVLDTGDEKVSVWGSTVLNMKLRGMPSGARIRITYTANRPSPNRKGKNYKDFTVEVDDDTVPQGHGEEVIPPPDDPGF